jgi:hypothetical protein
VTTSAVSVSKVLPISFIAMDYIGARKKLVGHPNLMKCFRAGSILTTSTRPFFVVASDKKITRTPESYEVYRKPNRGVSVPVVY